MRILICFVVCAVCGMVMSCRTPSLINTEIIREVDSVYIETLVPIAQPVDSASIRALLECDKNGRVVLSWLDLANSDRAKLQFQLDSLGNLFANFSAGGDTIYVPQIIEIYREKESTRVDVPVEKELTGWQKFFIKMGYISCLIMVFYLWKILRKLF